MPKYRAIEYLRLSKEKKGEQNESNSITNRKKSSRNLSNIIPTFRLLMLK